MIAQIYFTPREGWSCTIQRGYSSLSVTTEPCNVWVGDRITLIGDSAEYHIQRLGSKTSLGVFNYTHHKRTDEVLPDGDLELISRDAHAELAEP